jgi:hypothetical protein
VSAVFTAVRKRDGLEDDPPDHMDLTDEEYRLCLLYDEAYEAAAEACCSGVSAEPLKLTLRQAPGFW